jgi:hypothetical protein
MYAAGMAARPIGITILAILAAVDGLWHLAAGSIFIGFQLAGLFVVDARDLAGYPTLWGIIQIAVGVVLLVVAAGLWSLVRTAWTAALVVALASLAIHVLNGLGTGEWQLVTGVLLPVAILWYLTRPDVRSSFTGP